MVPVHWKKDIDNEWESKTQNDFCVNIYLGQLFIW